jgi:hypothetical protein
MEAALLREGGKMTHIIGPKTGHAYEPSARKTVALLVDEAVHQSIRRPLAKVTLVTPSLKYTRAHCVTVDALERHWQPARVEADFKLEGDAVQITQPAPATWPRWSSPSRRPWRPAPGAGEPSMGRTCRPAPGETRTW